jgi:signal transduction histidine kinase
LDLLVETVLFRIAQEALSNVARHAACPQAWLNLKFNQGKVILSIQDNGVGFNSSEELRPPRGWGIAGMRERAESVGGSLRVHSAPGKGTLVEAVVPLPDSSSAAQEVEPYELDPVDIG